MSGYEGKNMEAKSPKPFDAAIFIVVAIVICLVIWMLSENIISQVENYKKAIEFTLSSHSRIDHSAVIAYSRSWDFAIIKTSSLFMSLLIILLGSLYVLRVAESQSALSVESRDFRGVFSTSSPGLVLALFGVILVIVSLSSKSEIKYKSPSGVGGIVKEKFEAQWKRPIELERGDLNAE